MEPLPVSEYPQHEPDLMQIDPVLFQNTHGALPNIHYSSGAQNRNHNELPSMELIQQIVAEYGNFQNITEEGLEEKSINSPEETKVGDENDNEDDLSIYIKESIKEREVMIQHVHAAVNSANIASDLVSLVVSKIRPNAAQTTMSSLIKQHVKTGSLSYSVIPKPEDIDEEKAIKDRRLEIQRAKLIGRGWKLQMLKQCSEMLHDSSVEMKQRIEIDKVYWGDMIDIAKSGEIITSTSNKEMCVKYGFGDSGSIYYDKGVGILKRGDNGHIIFDKIVNKERDVVWGGENVCVLKIYKMEDNEKKLIGESNTLEFLQRQIPQLFDEGIVETSGSKIVLNEISKSRFVLFENELYWHLIKEATGLISLNVELIDDEEDSLEMNSLIRFHLPSATSGELIIEISKMKINEPKSILSSNLNLSENSRANELILLLRLLLCESHKRNLEMRNSPPMAMSSQMKSVIDPREKYGFLIRPIIMYSRHNFAIAEVKIMLKQWGDRDIQIEKFIGDNNTEDNQSSENDNDNFFHTVSTNVSPETKVKLVFNKEVSVEIGITSLYRTVDVTYEVDIQYKLESIFNSKFSNKVEMDECINWVLKPYL